MGKPALGRGLGQLLESGKSPPTFLLPGKPLTSAKPSSPVVARNSPPVARATRSPFLLPAWFCFGSDLALLGLAAALVYATPPPLPVPTWLVVAACTLLGCGLGLLGVATASVD